MNRILYLATNDMAIRTGGGLAVLAYYNALMKLFPNQVDLAMAEECCVGKYRDAIRIPPRSKWKQFSGLLLGDMHRNKDFFKRYFDHNNRKYDICVINNSLYAGDMMDLLHDKGMRIVVIHHNFEREYNLDNKTPPTLYGLTPYFVIRNERNAYMKSEVNCFLTEADRQLFHRHYGESKAKEYVIGTFEPTESDWNKIPLKRDISKNIVITGSMDSVQTIAGIMDFKQKYLRIVLEKFSDWKIIIAGRNPSESIQQLSIAYPDRVQVVPNPPVMDDIVAKGSIFLCPTHVGGGLKLRVMDGLRRGLPVLTHKVSARGYDAFFNSPFFKVYDDETSFETGMIDLVNYVDSNSQYQQEIIDIYKSTFGFEVGCQRMKKAMDIFL